MKRAVTRTGTVTITGRETRLRALLAAIAHSNDNGRHPGKADVVGNVPSQTRAGRYRLIDDLISRHLVNPGLDSKGYHLEITAAGREVLEHGTAEVTWQEDEYGVIEWTITEHTCDGASFTSSFDDREKALEFAAGQDRTVPSWDSVAEIVLSQLRCRAAGVMTGAEVLTSETIWSRTEGGS